MTFSLNLTRIKRINVDNVIGWIINLLVVIVVILVGYILLIEPFPVDGNSMAPKFHSGDVLLLEKISYLLKNPQRGDVVIFHQPKIPVSKLIKRVIAIPGDKIMIKASVVWLNDTPIEEIYLSPQTKSYGSAFLHEGKEYVVLKDEYIVMGDNRELSTDSRMWGAVAKNNIIGRVFFRIWPL